jgi:hypothetical protein
MLVSTTPVGQVYSCHLTKAVEGFLKEWLRNDLLRGNHALFWAASRLPVILPQLAKKSRMACESVLMSGLAIDRFSGARAAPRAD